MLPLYFGENRLFIAWVFLLCAIIYSYITKEIKPEQKRFQIALWYTTIVVGFKVIDCLNLFVSKYISVNVLFGISSFFWVWVAFFGDDFKKMSYNEKRKEIIEFIVVMISLVWLLLEMYSW